MNTIQAVIILKSGIRKYGMIIDGEYTGSIQFVPEGKALLSDELFNNVIEYIPLGQIQYIDTCLK